MTDDDKALVERLRADWPEILVEKHWMMDSDAIEEQRKEAADRIEALTAENERLRQPQTDALKKARELRQAIREAGVKRTTPRLYAAVIAFDVALAALEQSK